MNPALLALAVTLTAPVKDPPKKDPPGLVGEWLVESAVVNGKRDDPPFGTIWVFTADKKSVLNVAGDRGASGTYTADPAKDPPQVDISTGQMGKPMRGIYRVEKGTLTLCLVEGEGERPTAFESKAGSMSLLLTLKPVKKKE